MTVRINAADPVDNVGALCEELEAQPEESVFVSASAETRERVTAAWPGVLVLGDNPFSVRGELLAHPSLQVAQIREESPAHGAMVKALFERERARRATKDPASFLASLEIRCKVRKREAEDLDRAYDLVLRTNQFTTTARQFTRRDLAAMARGEGDSRLYTLWVEDRFADYGLVGVCVAEREAIELFLLACRVVALGVENVFLQAVLADLFASYPLVRGRLLELAENLPARALFRANGFVEKTGGLWEIGVSEAARLPPPPYVRVTIEA